MEVGGWGVCLGVVGGGGQPPEEMGLLNHRVLVERTETD